MPRTDDERHHSVPGLVFAGFLTFIAIILVAFFKTDYKRLKAEDINKAKMILNNDDILVVSSHNSFADSGQYQPIFS